MKIPKHLPIYVIILFLITLFLRIVLVHYYNNNLGGIELNVVYGIQRILLGQPLYQDPASGSNAVMQYTPLWYYFIAGIAKLTGVTGLNVQGIFVLCRIAALLFNLLTISVCALIIRGMKFSWLHSFVFSLPVLMVLTSHYYTRGDSMHLFMFMAAIAAYIQHNKKGAVQYIILAALFSAGCIMVKQSGVLCTGIICCCLLFIHRKYLLTVLYVACTTVFSYLILRLCIPGSSPHLFYLNAWLGLKNGIGLSFLYTLFAGRYFLDLVPFYFLGGLMSYLAINTIKDTTYRILATGITLSWLFAVVTGLKTGSSNNYFTEFLVMVLVAIPCMLQNVQEQKISTRTSGNSLRVSTFAFIAFFILITSKTTGFFSAVYIEKSFKNNIQEYADEQQLYHYFQDTLKIKKGEKIFFTERRFLDNLFIEYAIMPTKDVVNLVYTADTATYNYSGFTTGMNTGMIKYIVTSEKRDDINVCSDSLPFIHFDKNKFKLVTRVSGYSIYAYSHSG